jgi:CRP/FNR family cyclic AMP-dependent transcriptional regulator
MIEKLRRVELFQGIKDDEERLSELAGIVSVRQCNAGEDILEEGEAGSEFFILNKGAVDVRKRTLDNDFYTIITLTHEEDVFFGELALMDEERRSASVTANTRCEFLVIERDDFLRLGEEDPWLGLSVTRAIGRALSRRLRKADDDLIVLFEALVGEVAESGNLEETGQD